MVLAFVFAAISGNGTPSSAASSGPPGALDLAAPPNADQLTGPCGKLLAVLPVRLGTLDPRVVHTKPETPFVVAWGDPAVVLRCGVERPASLTTNSATLFVNGGAIPGPYFDVTREGDANVWTSVDREPYLSITVPKTYNSTPLPTLSRAIEKSLPAVCSTEVTAPTATRCTRRP